MKLPSIHMFLFIFLVTLSHGQIALAREANNDMAEEIEKGPNNGRLLRQDDFALELAIFEEDTPPEFRVFITQGERAVDANEVLVNVKLTRLGNVIDDINFYQENHYLRGDMEIYEPHSFVVSVHAEYQGREYQWEYDNFEGRTKISDQMATAIELNTATIGPKTFDESLKVYGKIRLAPNAMRHVSARFDGQVRQLHATFGQRVEKGQLLITVESNESLQTHKIFAPITGVITEQNTATGEQTQGKSLLTITDSNQLMAELAVFPSDIHKVSLGAPVVISVPGSEQVIETKISDSLVTVNANQSKVLLANIDNSDGYFNPGQFVVANIALGSYQVPLAIESEALQSFRDFTVAYAKVGEEYEVRMLELGRQVDGWVEILGGIKPGTEYVNKNSYLIKADIEKLGASHDH